MVATYLSVVLTIGLLILIHELGHFLTARAVGLPVAAFSIGFGPVLVRRQYGGVEYRLSAIPLGGYVLADFEDPESYLATPWLRRLAFSLGGPLANLAAAALIYAALALIAAMASGSLEPAALLWEPLARTGRAFTAILAGLAAIIETPGQLMGVVGLVVEGGRFVGPEWTKGLTLAAWLSVNLAVFNLLPLPPLDGGKMVLDTLHRLHKPLARLYVPISLVGWVAMAGLMIYATVLDAGRYLV